MKLLRQSEELRNAFLKKINNKVLAKQEKVKDKFGDNPFGKLIEFGVSIQQTRNEFVGNLGELSTLASLNTLPDDWVMFQNALIPDYNNNLTEIDILIIGTKGIFLVEVKTWKGSFSAYRDKWKMKQRYKWIPLEHSPSSQSIYHKKIFSQWLRQKNISIPNDYIIAPVLFLIARWLGITNCSVPVFKNQIDLLKFIKSCPDCLSLKEIEMISQTVKNCELKNILNISKPKPILRRKP